jgi:hypothetical protein
MKQQKPQTQRRAKDQRRIPLSMRIAPQTRARLEFEAARTGRSITQEAELRLEMALLVMSGGADSINAELLAIFHKVLTAADQIAQARGNPSWLLDRPTFDDCVTALNEMFQGLRPEAGSEQPEVPQLGRLLIRQPIYERVPTPVGPDGILLPTSEAILANWGQEVRKRAAARGNAP